MQSPNPENRALQRACILDALPREPRTRHLVMYHAIANLRLTKMGLIKRTFAYFWLLPNIMLCYRMRLLRSFPSEYRCHEWLKSRFKDESCIFGGMLFQPQSSCALPDVRYQNHHSQERTNIGTSVAGAAKKSHDIVSIGWLQYNKKRILVHRSIYCLLAKIAVNPGCPCVAF